MAEVFGGDLAVGEGLRGDVGLRKRGGFQESFQGGIVELGEVRHLEPFLILVFDAPDAAAELVAIRMGARHFVMADDLVIPIHDIHASVRPKGEGDGAEPRIVAGEEVRDFVELPVGEIVVGRRLVASHHGGVDAAGDRVRDEHEVAVGCGISPLGIGEGEAAEAGAAEALFHECGGKFRRVAFPLGVRAAGVVAVFVEGHDTVAEVVGFLDEGFAVAIHGESPDVAGAVRGDLELAAIRAEARHAGLVELDGLFLRVLRAFHLAVVESALRHPDPAAGGAGELVGEKVGVLHAEALEDDLALIGYIVVVRVR